MAQLRGSNSVAVGWLMQYLVDAGSLPTNVVAMAQRVIGDTKITTPSTYRMAKRVSEATEKSLALDLYQRLYVPLSTLFAHANGLVLMRHVGKKASIQERPSYPWVRLSAVRICDVSVGILALAVSEKSDLPTQMYVEYANSHMRRSLAPIFVMGLRSARGSMQWRNVLGSIQAVLAGTRYVRSEAFKIDPPQVKLKQVRAHLETIFDLFDLSDANEVREAMLDAFAEVIANVEPETGTN
jgi:hypothetical protein